MKIISLLSVVASLTTAVALPLRPEIAGTLLFAAGLALIIAQDYAARRALRFETSSPAGGEFAARHFFHQRTPFRAPALTVEANRLAA